ncbi:hypothetical protein [Modestobacter sp. DSM 44400]|uniref:hypothetical protein n=1 Tax=Modestobacter sp. DSM 44400 TaxID=1550230 RepID=UPI000B2102C0|nr:hypothetical protein [Modestobacter sp. DSM 44400]
MSTAPPEDVPGEGSADAESRATTSPQVSTAPATNRRRLWPRSVPARIGRARTSTVALGTLFVIAGLLYVPPVSTDTTSGTPAGNIAPVTTPAEAPAPTTSEAPVATTSGPTQSPTTPSRTTTSGAETTGPADTGAPSSGTTSGAPATTTPAPATPSQAPAPSSAPESAAPSS